MNIDKKTFKKPTVRWQLVIYDLVLLIVSGVFLFAFTGKNLTHYRIAGVMGLGAAIVFLFRFIGRVYSQIWRYGGIQCYIRLIITDAIAFVAWYVLDRLLPFEHIDFARLLAVSCLNLLAALAMRMFYRYAFKCGNKTTVKGRILLFILRMFAGSKVEGERAEEAKKISIAIIGAGRVETSLAEELSHNSAAIYAPVCFVDNNPDKAGRETNGIPVLRADGSLVNELNALGVQEVVIAIPDLGDDQKKVLYDFYKDAGYKVKVYDYPAFQSAGSKRRLREFDIEELLFRKQVIMENKESSAFYKDKVIMITGGGGSIGSELCRQVAAMEPKQIIIVDIYENGAYDVQQELKIRYGSALDIRIHIVSYTNKRGLERVFRKCRPDIVINAAAHKHVPLMETDAIEAVENNVFGTLNTVELSEKYGAQRFIQVSTDKAVNPTNVMGATKRMCEYIVQAHSVSGTSTTFSATRFGNVLGSAGSVIPLFKKQIANGGPITVTDKRIIRYFMTIPEAAQLVLQSGAMAKNGELFVLDMGKPVKIYDLAESMIRLSGMTPGVDISIVETGLRPGEKLYEELLIQSEELTKTDNNLIFIEKDMPISMEELSEKLSILKAAAESDVEDSITKALMETVPTYHPKTPTLVADTFDKNIDKEIAIRQLDAIKGKYILIVDDLSLNRDIASDTLNELGMVTDMASDGKEAIMKVKNNKYDYVLMDIMMPEMDGYDAAREIKKIDSELPVIAMTASSPEECKEKAFAAGMSAFIPKPIHLDELLAAMTSR